MQRRYFTLTLSALMLGLATSPTISAENQAPLDGKVVLSRLLDIIDQVGIILPGEGFKSIKLQDPIEKLIRLLG